MEELHLIENNERTTNSLIDASTEHELNIIHEFKQETNLSTNLQLQSGSYDKQNHEAHTQSYNRDCFKKTQHIHIHTRNEDSCLPYNLDNDNQDGTLDITNQDNRFTENKIAETNPKSNLLDSHEDDLDRKPFKNTAENDQVSTPPTHENISVCDDFALEEKFRILLKKTDDYSKMLIGGSKTQNQNSKKKSSEVSHRSHLLTEKEEDDNLLLEAEDENSDSIITQQPTCIKGKMKHYQIEGLNWLYRLFMFGINGILADEMGLGKTLQTISILGYLMTEKKIVGPHLIICPRSTLENWCNEVKRWCPILRVVRFHGSKEERDDIMSDQLKHGLFDICITTYEMVIREKTQLTRFKWTYLIMDEAHRIKNEKSVLSEVVRTFKPQRRLLITGTPLQNNLKELWALLNFLMPQLFDSSEDFNRFFDFSRMYSDQQFHVVEVLHKILRPFMLRRLKIDVETDLPPKRELFVFVGMSKLQKEIYSSILAKNIEVLNAVTGNKAQMLNILMQLRKCCNHPYLFDGVEKGPPYIEGPHMIETSGKMALLDKLLPRLKKQNSRVLLFSQMTRLIDIVDDYCRWKGYEYCRIDGSTAGLDRQEKIDEFNKPNSTKFIFLLSTRAGGLGINLATADIVILFDSDFNPQMDLQAMDRAHRIGQKKHVIVYRFIVKNCVEERIVERARKKLMLESLIIQKGRLSQQAKQPSTNELHEMIQFGAQEVYHTQDESSITDDDIDKILADANETTQEIESSMENLKDKFDLSMLSLDGGLHMYAEKEDREDNKKIKLKRSSEFFELGDRKTKWRSKSKLEDKKPKKTIKRKLFGWRAEANGGHDFQFFDSERLDKLQEIEDRWKEWEAARREKLEKLDEYAEEVCLGMSKSENTLPPNLTNTTSLSTSKSDLLSSTSSPCDDATENNSDSTYSHLLTTKTSNYSHSLDPTYPSSSLSKKIEGTSDKIEEISKTSEATSKPSHDAQKAPQSSLKVDLTTHDNKDGKTTKINTLDKNIQSNEPNAKEQQNTETAPQNKNTENKFKTPQNKTSLEKSSTQSCNDIYQHPPTLKQLTIDQLRRVLHVLEFHMKQHHDHTHKSRQYLMKRCKALITPPTVDEFTFSHTNFHNCLEELEAMLNDGRARELEMPCACEDNDKSEHAETKEESEKSIGLHTEGEEEGNADEDIDDSMNTNVTQTSQQTSYQARNIPTRRASIRLKRKELDDEDMDDPNKPPPFTIEMYREKQRLLKQGFISWTRTELHKFIHALTLYGRDHLEEIWQSYFKNSNKTLKELKRYLDAFYDKFTEIEGGERMMGRIKKADSERSAVMRQNEAILDNVEKQIAKGLNRPQDLKLPDNLVENIEFTPEQDKVLLWGLYEHGSNAYERVHVASRYYWHTSRGFFAIASKTLKSIEERCHQIVSAVEHEWLPLQSQKNSPQIKFNRSSTRVKANHSSSTTHKTKDSSSITNSPSRQTPIASDKDAPSDHSYKHPNSTTYDPIQPYKFNAKKKRIL